MGDYDYANARLRALKALLFDRQTLSEFAALSRVDDLIARLADSTYGDEIRTALARYVGARAVMEACRLHLAQTYRKVRGFYDGEGARLVAILLARWDLHNLKAILRGQEAHVPAGDLLEALVPAGELDESALRTLARQPDPTATADLLRTWNTRYASAVRSALAEFANTHEWFAFEFALDSLFYERLLGALEKGEENDEFVHELLGREIDATNLLTALRLRGEPVARERGDGKAVEGTYWLRGGELSPAWLSGLAHAARDEEALSELRSSRFGTGLNGLEKLDLAAVQRALDLDLARFGISFFSRDPLTIAPAIGFITAKKVEATNLRVIAHGLSLNLGRAEIEKELLC